MLRAAAAMGIVSMSATLAYGQADPAPRGPQVEITGKDGKTVACTLLSMAGGNIEVLLPDGKREAAQNSDVKSIRFVPAPSASAAPPMLTTNQKPADPPDKAPNDDRADPGERRSPNWTFDDGERLRRLNVLDREGKISAAEAEELNALRARAPLPPILKIRTAEENARQEALKGRLDNYISGLQQKLREARAERDVKDAIVSLSAAYRQKRYSLQKSTDQLKTDIEGIAAPKIREKSLDRFNELLEIGRGDNSKK
jgi:hypothetical protein